MSGISSTTGLISGMDIGSLVTQLMAIEKRPLTLVQNRVAETQTQQTAYTELNARLTAALAAVGRLAQPSSFSKRKASSANEDVLTATASPTAQAGTYSFTVARLATTHQLVSTGFVDRASTPVGAGVLTFESSAAQINPDTALSTLNGMTGVRLGQVRVTDRSGASTQIDLRSAASISDVVEAFNSQSVVSVRASIQGDHLVIQDQTGLATGRLTITDTGGGSTASDLGILGSDADAGNIAGRIAGQDLVRLAGGSLLSALNDGLGVRFSEVGDDLRISLADGSVFDVNLTSQVDLGTNLAELNSGRGTGAGTIRITNRLGASADVQLSGTETLGEVRDKIAALGIGVSLSSVSSGGSLTLADSTGGTGRFRVQDVSGSVAATLRLNADVAESTIAGRAGYSFDDLAALFRRIQYAHDGSGALNNGRFEMAVSADGTGLMMIDRTTGGASAGVTALNNSQAAADLGLEGSLQGGSLTSRRLAGGLNSVLLTTLNGGRGVQLGQARFSLHDGTTHTVDFTGAETLQEVLDRVNAVSGLQAGVAEGGSSISIHDTTTGTGLFTASDLSGTTLADLQLTADATGNLAGGDLNRRYISENTLLTSLNGGQGLGLAASGTGSSGSFQITSGEATLRVTISSSVHKTVGDVLAAITKAASDAGAKLSATISPDGDGIQLFDGGGGSQPLKVSEVDGGGLASRLGLLGEASTQDPDVFTGSFARRVEIGPTDTLDELVKKLNEAGAGIQASVVNDGSASRPYRLVLMSVAGGQAGQITYHTGDSGLSLGTLTSAQDARIIVGTPGSANAIVASSFSNTVSNLVSGLELNLHSAGSQPVQVTVENDLEAVITDVQGFVEAYNGLFDRIDSLTSYDAETESRGVLLGDNTVSQVRDRLYRQVSRTLGSGYSVRRLSAAGITFKKDGGGRLELDADKFKAAYAGDPQGVEALFTKVETTTDANGDQKPVYVGIAASLREEIKSLTSTAGGLLTAQVNRLGDKVEMFNRRISDLQELLDMKEARLYAQFQAMETALARLQEQQTSISALASQASSGTT